MDFFYADGSDQLHEQIQTEKLQLLIVCFEQFIIPTIIPNAQEGGGSMMGSIKHPNTPHTVTLQKC